MRPDDPRYKRVLDESEAMILQIAREKPAEWLDTLWDIQSLPTAKVGRA